MFNKYYRINESRWTLPEEDYDFKYPDYEKRERNIDKENFKEGWDKDIIEELTKFYNENKDFIVTEYDELERGKWYYYIIFPEVTEEKIKIYENKIITDLYFNGYKFSGISFPKNRNYEIRKVIREHPELNPSYILFKEFKKSDGYYSLCMKLNVLLEIYTFYPSSYNRNKFFPGNKRIFWNGYWI